MLRPASLSLAACLLLLLPAAAGARTDAPSPARTVRSADGLLTLAIPRGALARTVPIRIRKLAPSRYPRELRGLRGGGPVYSLEPAGLRFRKSVTLTRRIRGLDLRRGVSLVALSLRDGRGGWSLPAGQRIRLAGKTVVVSGTIRHFSTVAVLGGLGTVSIDPTRFSRKVGEGFNTNVYVSERRNVLRFPLNWENVTASVGRRGVLEVLDPESEGLLPDMPLFRCKARGSDIFHVDVDVEVLAPRNEQRFLGKLMKMPLKTSVRLSGFAVCSGGAPAPPPKSSVRLTKACVEVIHRPLGSFPSFLGWVVEADQATVAQGAQLRLQVEGGNGGKPLTAPFEPGSTPTGEPVFRAVPEMGIDSFGTKRLVGATVDGGDVTDQLTGLLGGRDVNVTASEGFIAGSGCP